MNNILSNINPSTFTGSAIFVGLLLINELTNDEQVSVGNWFELVGMVLQTYSSQVSTNQSVQAKDTDANSTRNIDTLKMTIDKIKECLDKM